MSHQTDASLTLKHPIQPLYIDQSGLARFKENAIVVHLLDNGGIDMNALAFLDFTQSDREQFAELIGYSLRGFSELSYVTDETLNAAVAMIDVESELAKKSVKGITTTAYIAGANASNMFQKCSAIGKFEKNEKATYINDLLGWFDGVPVLRSTDIANGDIYAIHKTPDGQMAPLTIAA
jgi:hypothetical protein